MPYFFVDANDGTTDVLFRSRDKSKEYIKIGCIKNRQFKRHRPKNWNYRTGKCLDFVQTLSAYHALVKGLIGPP